MPRAKTTNYVDNIDAAVSAALSVFNVAVLKEAERFRESVLLPFCRKHQLRFISGNGEHFFISDKHGEIVVRSAKGAEKIGVRGAEAIFAALDLEIPTGSPFSHYVEEITGIDIQAMPKDLG